MLVPIELKKGLNEFFVRGTNVKADLILSPKPVMMIVEDLPLPTVVVGKVNNNLTGALIVMNTGSKEISGLEVKSKLAGNELSHLIPTI